MAKVKQCSTCKNWTQTTEYECIPNSGACPEISNKITVNIEYGMDGGYIADIETEGDFGCNSWIDKETE